MAVLGKWKGRFGLATEVASERRSFAAGPSGTFPKAISAASARTRDDLTALPLATALKSAFEPIELKVTSSKRGTPDWGPEAIAAQN